MRILSLELKNLLGVVVVRPPTGRTDVVELSGPAVVVVVFSVGKLCPGTNYHPTNYHHYNHHYNHYNHYNYRVSYRVLFR